MPAMNESAFTDRVIESPSCRHRDSLPDKAVSISSCESSFVIVVPLCLTTRLNLVSAGAIPTPGDLRPEPDDRVVLAVDHAFLHRDDRVVGDLDALRTDLGAALGDVAHPDALLRLGELPPIGPRIQWMHVQLGGPDEEARPGERSLVVLVIPRDVADVLAQETLDALAELLG